MTNLASTGSLWRRRVIRASIGGAALYVAYFASVALFHRTVLFPQPRSGLEPILEGGELLRFEEGDVEAVGMFAPPTSGRRVVVFFHGNGDELVDTMPFARRLREAGLGVLFVEYPGYGIARGKPSEETIYRAAQRLLDELPARGVDPEQVVLVGQSLGSGVAAEMAARGHGRGMILISPYTSITGMVQRFAPGVPVDVFVKDRFDTLSKCDRISIPTLVIHGDRDTLIPIDMGRDIAARIRGAELEVIEGGEHNDLFRQKDDKLQRLVVSFSLADRNSSAVLHEARVSLEPSDLRSPTVQGR